MFEALYLSKLHDMETVLFADMAHYYPQYWDEHTLLIGTDSRIFYKAKMIIEQDKFNLRGKILISRWAEWETDINGDECPIYYESYL